MEEEAKPKFCSDVIQKKNGEGIFLRFFSKNAFYEGE
jgi:hypothetical protein